MEYEEALKDILTCDKEKLKELGIWDKIYDKGRDRTLRIHIQYTYNDQYFSIILLNDSRTDYTCSTLPATRLLSIYLF
jgi:hypothetical protein